jgi:predicted metal-dependent enzyme (double-stranded beta helix superfamily)
MNSTCLTSVVADGLRSSCRINGDHQSLVMGARLAISNAVVNGHDIDAMWRESDPEKRLPGRYRRHQAVSDTEHGFTVVVLLWEPGAVTAVHDHDTWCVFGLFEGGLEITNYRVVEDVEGQPLVLEETERDGLSSGMLGDNRLRTKEIHRVRNVGTERAMSLHVYGSDLTRRKPFDGRGIRVLGKTECLAFQDQPAY